MFRWIAAALVLLILVFAVYGLVVHWLIRRAQDRRSRSTEDED